MLAPLAFVLFFSFRIDRMSAASARNMFFAFSAVMGLSLSTILLVYTGNFRRARLLHHGRRLRRPEPLRLHDEA